MKAPKPYRPSSGTEGDIFMSHWCAHCASNGIDEDACDIQLAAIHCRVDGDQYPAEWVYVGTVPTCTAFHSETDDTEPAIRCDKTPDMFGEAV